MHGINGINATMVFNKLIYCKLEDVPDYLGESLLKYLQKQ